MGNNYRLEMHGSVIVLYPLSEACAEWCAENIGPDALWGSVHEPGYIIGPRYLDPILSGMHQDLGL